MSCTFQDQYACGHLSEIRGIKCKGIYEGLRKRFGRSSPATGIFMREYPCCHCWAGRNGDERETDIESSLKEAGENEDETNLI
jgi:hypothetical protein